jgi:NAD-specific glutamate dehydrogenase
LPTCQSEHGAELLRIAQQTLRGFHVRAAELRVSAGRLDLEHSLAELEDRDVEGSASEIEHRNAQLFGEPIEAVGERRRVGSFTSRRTSSPAIPQASRVAARWLSSK